MENLTNEQILSIIDFYKDCGISEDIYLSKNGVLDLFTLLGFSPEFDEDGNRLPTVYEQLCIPPQFSNGKEVPIVFAIKNKVSKIFKPADFQNIFYVYNKDKEEKANDNLILKKFRQDYFSAVASGNMNEATQIYDLINKITGGKADEFIGINYDCVKFYKKMQKQLLLDIFANFVILMILSNKLKIKEGLVRFDKLYKAFVQQEVSKGKFGYIPSENFKTPVINKMTVIVNNSDDSKSKLELKADKSKQAEKIVVTNTAVENKTTRRENFISFVKSKINLKLGELKNSNIFDFDENINSQKDIKSNITDEIKIEKNNILENN